MSEWQDNTGVCPVEKGTLVDVEYRCGAHTYGCAALVGDPKPGQYGVDDEGLEADYGAFCWYCFGSKYDIVKWRLHEEGKQDE